MHAYAREGGGAEGSRGHGHVIVYGGRVRTFCVMAPSENHVLVLKLKSLVKFRGICELSDNLLTHEGPI